MLRMKKLPMILALVFLVMLAGCTEPGPIVVYVTPTSEAPAPNSAGEVVFASTATDVSPTVTSTTAAEPTSLPGPTVTFMGAIVGEDYAPPTTNPPPATATPVPSVLPVEPTVSPPLVTDVPQLAPPTVTPEPVEPTAVTPAGTPIPILDTSGLGIQVDSRVEQDEWETIMNQVAHDLDMGWIKVQVGWSFFQPNGPDEISQEFRRLEIYLEQIRQMRQVKVLVSVAKAPNWTRTDTAEAGPPNDPQQLANFISLMLREFGGSVDAVEVWNEPNLSREWRGHPMTGSEYMRYFDAGYNAVRAYSPDIVVVSAGLAPTTDTAGSRDDRAYLREMYNAGLANYSNIGVGIHPYGWGNSPEARCCAMDDARGWDDAPQFFFLNTLEDYRSIMTNYGHSGVQLWVTEFGWATWEGLPGDPPDPWMTYNSKWDQANYTLQAIETMQGLDYVGPMFLWNLNFANPILIEQRDERIAYSIVLPEGAPRERPLYWMLYDAVRPDETLERYD
jgi:polysaccharide biosynthesis protein PslG